jgi:hypothetical protein
VLGAEGPALQLEFSDQHREITGILSSPGQPAATLTGSEVSGVRSTVRYAALSKLPKIGKGLVIPGDGRFIDPDDEEGKLKVAAGISLQEQGTAE